MDYNEFLAKKHIQHKSYGFTPKITNKAPFDWQKDIISWSCKKGRIALFEDCGLGKTLQQLEFGYQCNTKSNKPTLILAPLQVSYQTINEGRKFGFNVNLCKDKSDLKNGINITNYEKLEHFNADDINCIILDESSIIKSFTGKTRNQIIDMFEFTPYKMAATATPAPNDYMELGNHAEFLGVMSRTEMLSTFFIHDGGETAKWRLKGHAEDKFWEWVASWACVLKNPADLGYDGSDFILPKLEIKEHILKGKTNEFSFFADVAETLDERRQARKDSLTDRVALASEIANSSNEQVLVWCDFNAESEALKNSINGAVEVKGADTPEHKAQSMIDFSDGKIKCLVSKPSICGWGMNWQQCNTMIFCGLSDSYEQMYQAIRRCWRYGQLRDVIVHIIISENETKVLENIKRKEADAERMSLNMISHTKNITRGEIHKTKHITNTYYANEEMRLPIWLNA